jgi:hypothetical protein
MMISNVRRLLGGLNLRMDLHESPPHRHAQAVMAELGIKYEMAKPCSMSDSWTFYNVDKTTVPAELPNYLTVKVIGIAEWNREIEAAKKK